MSRKIKRYRDLDAWQAAMDLSMFAYELAKRLPPNERFELSAQMRRAAVSVPVEHRRRPELRQGRPVPQSPQDCSGVAG